MSLPVFGGSLDHIHVARAVGSLTRRRPGLSIPTAYGVVAADAALANGKTTVDDLQTWLGRLSRHPDVTHARLTHLLPGVTR